MVLIPADNQTQSEQLCGVKDRKLSSYLYMFLFAQTLHGVAGVLLYTLAPAYLDGSVSDKQSPIYMGKYGQNKICQLRLAALQ